MKTSAFVGTIAATFLIVSAAHAAKKNYQVDLSPDQENVTPDLGNADPTGSAKFTYDDQTKQLCGEITYTGLTGAAMGIHIHQAPPGNPEGDGVAPAQGKLIIPVGPSPVKFNFTLPQAFADSLDADELYANIHTVKNDKGEIRSQTPWDQPANATAVVCPPPTNPDGGVSTSSSSGGTDAGSTSSSSSSSSSGDTSSSSSSS
jgi:hypothetical protein